MENEIYASESNMDFCKEPEPKYKNQITHNCF